MSHPRLNHFTNARQYFSNRYSVSDRILGAGRYGNVYLATELATMKQIACKIVDLDLAMRNLSDSYRDSSLAVLRWKSGLESAKEERKRVLREIRILSKLSHVSFKIYFSLSVFF